MATLSEIRATEKDFGHPCSAVLASEDEFFRMLDATQTYERDGDRAALFRALLALGVDAECIRWHAEHVGLTAASYPD